MSDFVHFQVFYFFTKSIYPRPTFAVSFSHFFLTPLGARWYTIYVAFVCASKREMFAAFRILFFDPTFEFPFYLRFFLSRARDDTC